MLQEFFNDVCVTTPFVREIYNSGLHMDVLQKFPVSIEETLLKEVSVVYDRSVMKMWKNQDRNMWKHGAFFVAYKYNGTFQESIENIQIFNVD